MQFVVGRLVFAAVDRRRAVSFFQLCWQVLSQTFHGRACAGMLASFVSCRQVGAVVCGSVLFWSLRDSCKHQTTPRAFYTRTKFHSLVAQGLETAQHAFVCLLWNGHSSFSCVMAHAQSLWSDFPLFLLPQHVPSLPEYLTQCWTILRSTDRRTVWSMDWTKSSEVVSPTSPSRSYLGCTQRHWEISKDIVENYRTMFESRFSAGASEKFPCSEHLCISSWSYDMEGHAKECVERYCELANRTTQQLYKVSIPCFDDHQKRRIEICGRIVKRMFSNCSEMLVFGTYWKTRYSMVSEQICTIDHKMDQSLWQTPISFDLPYSSHKWIPTMLSCGKQCKTVQLGLFSGLRFCRRSWGLEIYVRWSIVCFWKSYICSNQLDV